MTPIYQQTRDRVRDAAAGAARRARARARAPALAPTARDRKVCWLGYGSRAVLPRSAVERLTFCS